MSAPRAPRIASLLLRAPARALPRGPAALAAPARPPIARASSSAAPGPASQAADLPRRPLSRAADDVLVPDFAGVADPMFPPDEKIEVKRARLMYMARKRGILESDLLMGTFAMKYLKEMPAEQLAEFDSLLKENDWDIYYWATGAKEAPEDIKELSIWPHVVEHAKNKGKKILRMPDLSGGKSDLDP
ncbi:Flavinator of succinate dehydrogenase-domain-containing protein [Hyaloraphidium curvatum]|nr:Flavinator of succinate dehydrogenase-domain-containing protein [Hyaloraphidium curvatum]